MSGLAWFFMVIALGSIRQWWVAMDERDHARRVADQEIEKNERLERLLAIEVGEND